MIRAIASHFESYHTTVTILSFRQKMTFSSFDQKSNVSSTSRSYWWENPWSSPTMLKCVVHISKCEKNRNDMTILLIYFNTVKSIFNIEGRQRHLIDKADVDCSGWGAEQALSAIDYKCQSLLTNHGKFVAFNWGRDIEACTQGANTINSQISLHIEGGKWV